ncbi:C39 family peptidase [Gordonia sp. N1V]|uniref:C39 family peptidase n=1 Tax=Gordonia sp. N1V TaxID=3034163 RepID=UPI0023E14324|nr:C39 family peptidase [Gordonia sp. N1V]MDF3280491.1 C39 family peptidase [Gordonia sp. N1V]
MTVRTLPVNAGIVTQETGYNCGPATTQNAIWAKTQRVVPESQLARELGTTVNGTDSIAYLDRVLGNHLGIDHLTQWITNDPPTAAQVNDFWGRLVRSVNAGYAVAMNWIAPPNNYPRGVGGSRSPSYGGGTVYHYTLAAGYDDAHRWVFVADSGFQPKTYWITVEQCMSLIAGKGYTYPNLPTGLKVTDVTGFTSAFMSAIGSDAKDVLAQIGGRWPQLGGRTVIEAIGELMKR